MAKTYDADVRYGSSFLSVSKHKKSVSGEIMTNKITGEVYIKRPADKKVISFKQKSQTVYEAVTEFNMQFQSANGFIFPNDPGSYLLGIKVDVDEFMDDTNQTDILLENHEFSESPGNYKDFRFEVSPKTNGIFIKPITRYGDRNACGYLQGQFSEHEYIDFTTTVRTFEEWLDLCGMYENTYLYTEWKMNEVWSVCNAMIDCTVVTTGMDAENNVITNEVKVSCPIQLNEYSYIRFPDDYDEEMETIYSINVIVNKIYAPKLQYERYLATNNEASSGVDSILERMLEVDNKVVLQSVDAFYFISGASQLPTNENTLIHQCIDNDFLTQATVTISTSTGGRAFQSQVDEPEQWPVDSVWAEELRSIENGIVTDTDSEDTFEDLERELYSDSSDTLTYTENEYEHNDLLIEDVTNE